MKAEPELFRRCADCGGTGVILGESTEPPGHESFEGTPLLPCHCALPDAWPQIPGVRRVLFDEAQVQADIEKAIAGNVQDEDGRKCYCIEEAAVAVMCVLWAALGEGT